MTDEYHRFTLEGLVEMSKYGQGGPHEETIAWALATIERYEKAYAAQDKLTVAVNELVAHQQSQIQELRTAFDAATLAYNVEREVRMKAEAKINELRDTLANQVAQRVFLEKSK